MSTSFEIDQSIKQKYSENQVKYEDLKKETTIFINFLERYIPKKFNENGNELFCQLFEAFKEYVEYNDAESKNNLYAIYSKFWGIQEVIK